MILQIRNRPEGLGQGYLTSETVKVKEICAPEMLYLYIRLNMGESCIGFLNDINHMIWVISSIYRDLKWVRSRSNGHDLSYISNVIGLKRPLFRLLRVQKTKSVQIWRLQRASKRHNQLNEIQKAFRLSWRWPNGHFNGVSIPMG